MRTSVTQLSQFYASPLGSLVAGIIRDKLVQAWGAADRLSVVGVGFADPFLSVFGGARCRLSLAPAALGVEAGAHSTCLTEDFFWPLKDASVERLLVIHGLEETPGPRRFLREAWRVLSDDGLMIVVAVNRRGPWALAENSPFAAGRPYSRHQLDELLSAMMFQPTARATALHFPPLANSWLMKFAPTWERMGAGIEGLNLPPVLPNLAGLNFIEARKSTALPAGGSRAELFRPGVLLPGRVADPVRRQSGEQSQRSAVTHHRPGNPS
ncbi:MAG: methyltransferase domain-containing protein [Parvularcula sp.]